MKEDFRKIPVVAIRESIVFPHTDAVLTFGRKKSVSALNSAFSTDRVIAIFTQKDPRTSNPGPEDLHKVGTIATITQMMKTSEQEIHAVVHGQARVELKEIMAKEPHLLAKVSEIPDEYEDKAKVDALAKKLSQLFKKAVNMGKQAEVTIVVRLVSGNVEPNELADQIASFLEIKTSQKQKILEAYVLERRLERVIKHLSHEVQVLDLEKSISSKTQKRFEDQMRKAMLREKKKTIEEELGEEITDLSSEEIKNYRKKIKEAKT